MFHSQGQHLRKLLPCVLLSLIVGVLTEQRSVSSKRDCSKDEYWNNGLCCDKCAPGYKLIRKCDSIMASQCEKCSEGTYLEKMNYFPNCFRCEKCTKRNAVVISPCTPQKNTVCGCQPGYYKRVFDQISWDCVPIKRTVSVAIRALLPKPSPSPMLGSGSSRVGSGSSL
ncbi:tumor necrosis factor receptor superfamily member 1A-like [Carassius carassius]|uniref:tumor necrosis factor receptor superfamily member 1A-like n=1 Tax=Carassius carassius TaxID=217509 RepID=UPI002868B407|nr:tumor necrosis factor receptor superfamily member 1A-like [Carassius carassius]